MGQQLTATRRTYAVLLIKGRRKSGPFTSSLLYRSGPALAHLHQHQISMRGQPTFIFNQIIRFDCSCKLPSTYRGCVRHPWSSQLFSHCIMLTVFLIVSSRGASLVSHEAVLRLHQSSLRLLDESHISTILPDWQFVWQISAGLAGALGGAGRAPRNRRPAPRAPERLRPVGPGHDAWVTPALDHGPTGLALSPLLSLR